MFSHGRQPTALPKDSKWTIFTSPSSFLRRQWQPTPAFLPGESPWTQELGRIQSMGSQRVRHDWVTNTHTHTHILLLGAQKGFYLCAESPNRRIAGSLLCPGVPGTLGFLSHPPTLECRGLWRMRQAPHTSFHGTCFITGFPDWWILWTPGIGDSLWGIGSSQWLTVTSRGRLSPLTQGRVAHRPPWGPVSIVYSDN